jgi:hypothetical protein
MVVVACVATPFALGQLSLSIEQSATADYIRALESPASAPPTDAAPAQTPARPGLLDEHFYLVNGCVSVPFNCSGASEDRWGEYYAELRRLYYRAVGEGQSGARAVSFERWAIDERHVRLVSAETAHDGALALERALAGDDASTTINVVGTSAGGAAVMSYLSRAMRGDAPLDRRVRTVLTVDSPLGFQVPFTEGKILDSLQAGIMKSDVEMGIGEWAKAAGIKIMTIDTPNDIVSHDPLPGITYDKTPVYRQVDTPPLPAYPRCYTLGCRAIHLFEMIDLGSTWHVYTGSHMADSARAFVDAEWR